MINILYDNNLILDLVDDSRSRHNLVIKTVKDNFLTSSSFISATTAERLYYQMDRLRFTKLEVDTIISKFEIAPVTHLEINLAQKYCEKCSDYEDAIEIAICELQKINVFVTADKKLFNKMQKLNLMNLKVELVK
jgi:predicted nucleic acid-binding protein